MQYPKGTTIAVIDGKRLALFRNTGNEAGLKLEALPEPALSPHNKGSGKSHHSSAANPDESTLEEDSHASAAADLLNQRVLSGEIGQLYIVAPPRTLGELRKHYNAALKKQLLGELTKEHTQDSIEALEKALTKAAS